MCEVRRCFRKFTAADYHLPGRGMILSVTDSFCEYVTFGILQAFRGCINAMALRGEVGCGLVVWLLVVVGHSC